MRNLISKRFFEGSSLVCVGPGDLGLAVYPMWTCPLGSDYLFDSLLL